MKAFLAACLAIVVITLGAWYGLSHAGFSAAEVTASPSVRLN